jgi:preprotein translocase SecF subunit
MIEIVKAGTKYPFIPNAKRFLFVSLMVVLGSVMLLATRGLNLGIDFKGGNKVIVAIKSDANADMDKIKATIASLIEEKTGEKAGQIEVQSFDLGETEGAEKFQIYTELTSLLKEEKAAEVNEKLGAALDPESVERPAETDKFIIVLKNPAPVNATKDNIAGMLKDLGFSQAQIVSEEERALDMEFYKDYNLSLVERQKEGREVPEDDFEKALEDHQDKKRNALNSRTDRTYTISLQQLQQDVEESLASTFGKENVDVESSTSVSPSVGADLFNKGMLAMIYAIIGILVYIGLRFDFRYSPGAVVALVHDTMITLGIFALFGIKFTLPIISALLTIIGYSLNDTIVVYDRIRENLTKFRGMDLEKLVNQSVNETLSRTLLTSITTLFVVVALLFLGGGLISDFALALTIGVIVGTYSSIFVASPLVIYIDRYLEDRNERAQKAPAAAA